MKALSPTTDADLDPPNSALTHPQRWATGLRKIGQWNHPV